MAKLSTPYAAALFRAAVERSVLAETAEALSNTVREIQENPELKAVLNHPRVAERSKKAIIKDCFAKDLNELLLNFFYVLVDNGRIARLPEIAADFKTLAYSELGLLEVEVTSASPLSEEQKGRLIESLSRKTKQKINLIETLDPSIIGGLIVAYGGQRLDGSLKTSLEHFRQTLTGLT
ncbi:MAG: ATP synthase F1 subunit delta [Eubacteriales bacterium]|nr:ATP synthase F1 subunit delta [Eubacteriales bacterium]